METPLKISSKWASFVKDIENDIKYRISDEQILENIESNEWYLEGSERYNLVKTESGVVLIPEIKKVEREAVLAKFGKMK